MTGMHVGAKIASSVPESQLWEPLSRDLGKPLPPSRSPFPRPGTRRITAPEQDPCDGRWDSPVKRTAQGRAQGSAQQRRRLPGRCRCLRSSVTPGAPRPAAPTSPEPGRRNPCFERAPPGESEHTPMKLTPLPFYRRETEASAGGGLTPGYTDADVRTQSPDPAHTLETRFPRVGLRVLLHQAHRSSGRGPALHTPQVGPLGISTPGWPRPASR